ncbi:MAG: MBL fold metallo-hydrolase [Pirellulales bacterium]|nr:MBL fold metallo-hydrolase [Pirellulales bacterium]
MFHYDRGLFLTAANLAVDVRRRQALGFISHAHTDHMARHERAICTKPTAALYRHRFGDRPTTELAYREPYELGSLELTLYPAGHCLGSAMLRADDGKQTLLYTGDFKLGPSVTAEEAELPRADMLIIETTFGNPKYRLPPRGDVIAELLDLVKNAFERGQTPIIRAYALGKAQEVTKILTAAGVSVHQPREVYDISQVYEACGCALGDYALFPGYAQPGFAVVAPPAFHKKTNLPGIKKPLNIAVTGWAIDDGTRWRFGADVSLPLSDHADYDELFEAIERVEPSRIYCTHGPESFVDRLREHGYPAFRLADGAAQTRLF